MVRHIIRCMVDSEIVRHLKHQVQVHIPQNVSVHLLFFKHQSTVLEQDTGTGNQISLQLQMYTP